MAHIDPFLEIESNEELFKYKIFSEKFCLWSFIRFSVLFSALYDKYNIPNPYDPIKVSPKKIIPYLLKTYKYRSSKVKKADVIFFGSDLSNIKTENGYFNRLSELFANETLRNVCIIEESSCFDYKRPRTFAHTYTFDDIILKSKIRSKLYKLNEKDLQTIDSFIRFLQENFPFKFKSLDFWTLLHNNLVRISKESIFKFHYFYNLLETSEPKLVFIEGASYGYGLVPLIKAAKDLNIPVYEYQHGLISLNHPAYNFHNKVPMYYNEILPDLFLSFGHYWKDNCRVPYPVKVIGYPFLNESSLQLSNCIKKRQLLFASSAIDPEQCVQNVLQVKKQLDKLGFEMVFRPHPSEHHRLETIYKQIKEYPIKIDVKPLYHTLAESEFVFGDFSTVLFEALKFRCQPITLKSNSTDMNVNINSIKILNSINELTAFINQDKSYDEKFDYIWEVRWKENFQNLLNDIKN